MSRKGNINTELTVCNITAVMSCATAK